MQREVAHASRSGPRLVRTTVVTLAFAAACASPAHQAAAPPPEPCSDSLYLQLKRTHPDSLSERAWQRLQTLDRDCAATRTHAQAEAPGMMGMGHGGRGRWLGTSIMAVILMVIVMTAMR